jgi:ubiquinone/menaquinone biosynthesis C-methylase UbiE
MNENKWDKIWEREDECSLSTDPTIYLSFIKQYKKKSRILDIGCGGMYFLELIDSNSFSSYLIGVDISKRALNIAKRRIKRERMNNYVELILASCFSLPFRDSCFDLTLFLSLLSFLTKKYLKALKEGYRVTKDCLGFNITHKEEVDIYRKIHREQIVLQDCSHGWLALFKDGREFFVSNETHILNLLKKLNLKGKINISYGSDFCYNTLANNRWKREMIISARKMDS